MQTFGSVFQGKGSLSSPFLLLADRNIDAMAGVSTAILDHEATC